MAGHMRYDDERNLRRLCGIGPADESRDDSLIEITIGVIFLIFAILVFCDHF